jgi:hypothetical protein
MAKWTNCLLLICALLATGAGAQEWKLIWSDEFNVAGMADPNKWDYEQGCVYKQQ